MRPKKRFTPFAVARGENGDELFVRTACVMGSLIATVDGLAQTWFGSEKHSYLRIVTAVEWIEKELPKTTGNERAELEKKLAVLREAMQKFAAGTMIENAGG